MQAIAPKLIQLRMWRAYEKNRSSTIFPSFSV